MSASQVSWSLTNLAKDREDLVDLVLSVVDILKFWINPALYKELEEKKQKIKERSAQLNIKDFIGQLQEHGASLDELKYITDIYK